MAAMIEAMISFFFMMVLILCLVLVMPEIPDGWTGKRPQSAPPVGTAEVQSTSNPGGWLKTLTRV